MKGIYFRLSSEETKALKIKVATLNLSIQDYLTALINLDIQKNYIKAAKQ